MSTIDQVYSSLITSSLSGTNLQREMFRLLRADGYTNQEILDGLREATRSSIESEDDNVITHIDCVNSTDPFTMEPIPDLRLVSVVENGKKYCFDSQSLYLYLKTSDRNPYTNVTLPSSFIHSIKLMYQSIEIFFNDNKITVSRFTQLGDIILEMLRRSPQNFPHSFNNNFLLNGHSLYEEDLFDEYPFENGDEVYSTSFTNNEQKDSSLLSLLSFLKKNILSSSSSYDSLYSQLGSYLAVSPVVMTPDGFDMSFDADDTLYDVIKKVYELLGGFQMIGHKSLVLDNCRPLPSFDLDLKVVDVIPGEIVRIVDVEQANMEDVRSIAYYMLKNNDDNGVGDLRRGAIGNRNTNTQYLYENYLLTQRELSVLFLNDVKNTASTKKYEIHYKIHYKPYMVHNQPAYNWLSIFYQEIINFFFTTDLPVKNVRNFLQWDPILNIITNFPSSRVLNKKNYFDIVGRSVEEVEYIFSGKSSNYDDVGLFDSPES